MDLDKEAGEGLLSEDEESEEEEEKRTLSKKEMTSNIDSQMKEMLRARALQAERKLQFLLQQSDIFKHFGVDSSKIDEKLSKKQPNKRRMNEKEGDSEVLQSDGDFGRRLDKQPPNICGEMRPYQLEGLNWLIRNHENGINGILADEMGLGKTLQSISILAYLHEFENIKGPHLILVPKSTMANWMNELKRWCPVIRGVKFHGSKEDRQATIDQILRPGQSEEHRDWDVVVTTYEVCNNEKATLQKFAWRYLIIDEAHRIKNEKARFSQTVRALHTQERLLITGTPLQNNLHELWALLNFLLPDIFSDSDQFDTWFDLEVDDREAKARMIGQLHKLLRPFMLRRLKADVEKSLPAKTETILYIGMSEMQTKLYKDLLSRNKDMMFGRPGAGNHTAVLNIVMQLRKCCNHPYLFQGMEDRSLDPHGSHLVENCGKLVLLDKLLVRLKSKGHRVLIFSQMTRMLDVLDDYLVSKQYQYCRIDGKTSYEERSDLIDAFNAPDSEKFVFLLSTRAGGLGINLQTADTVILFDSDWNPQADLQAQDRAHRIGQKKAVHVYRLVTEHTIEEKVVERAHQKLKLDAMVVQQGRLADKDRKLTKDDMLSAVKFGADHVFRSSESSITNEDIDVLIARGQKKTADLHNQLGELDKGDAYDFKFDGGFNAQTFQGVDYNDPKMRQAAIDEHLLSLMNTNDQESFIDRRARKPVANYNEDAYFRQMQQTDAAGDRRVKLPRHMRLPKMEDWQFFNTSRLAELVAMEEEAYRTMKANKELPAQVTKLQVLSDELQAEKDRLLSEGKADWTRQHYYAFIKASAKYGRVAHAKIALDIGKTEEEVASYATIFWERGPQELPLNEMENVIRRVEKGERKLGEIERLTESTAKFLAMWSDPITQLCFRFVGSHGHVFGADEDRHLLVFTNLHGYGNWARIRADVRNCEFFRFDYFLRSLSAIDIGKRCETLMREAAKELVELERRMGHSEEQKRKLLEETASPIKTLSEAEIDHLVDVRAKLFLAQMERQEIEKAEKAAKEALEVKDVKFDVKGEIKFNGASRGAGDDNDLGRDSGRYVTRPVTDEQLPSLLAIIHHMRLDSRDRIVAEFIKIHPLVSKRQVEAKLPEVALKEKRGDTRAWWLRPEFVRMHLDQNKTARDSELCVPEDVSQHGMDTSKDAGLANEEETPVEPHAPYSAKGLFRKRHLPEVKQRMGNVPKSAYKPELDRLWDALENTREWEEAALADQERYRLERAAYDHLMTSKQAKRSREDKQHTTGIPKKKRE